MLEPIKADEHCVLLDKDWYVAEVRGYNEWLNLEDTSKPPFVYPLGGTLEEVLMYIDRNKYKVFTHVPMEYVKEHLERAGYKVTVL